MSTVRNFDVSSCSQNEEPTEAKLHAVPIVRVFFGVVGQVVVKNQCSIRGGSGGGEGEDTIFLG